jgi:hypothetical protein
MIDQRGTDSLFHHLRVVLLVDVRSRRLVQSTQSRIPDLRRQTVFPARSISIQPRPREEWGNSQIQETRLAYILDLGTGGTDLGLLESSARSGVPTEDGEGTCADLMEMRD